MAMYEKDVEVKRITINCKNCNKFLGFRIKPKSLNDIGEYYCSLKCESEDVEGSKNKK